MRRGELVAVSNAVADTMARDACTVHVRPELVVEIAFNDIQESPSIPDPPPR